MYQDEILVCADCGGKFVFPVDEQQFYASRGIRSKPSRCQRCRERLKNDRFEAALRDPAKRFVYRCDLCSRQFVLTMQIRSARYVCPACAPGVLPKTEEDLNRYLGYPR